MKIAAQFSPNAQAAISTTTGLASGSFNAQLPQGPGKILVYNASLVDLIFSFGVSTFVDLVPAQSIRIFELELASWLISWKSMVPVSAFLLTGVQTSSALCTVIAYENSEDVPAISSTTSYVDPYNVVIQAGRDIEFTGTFTGNTAFTLQTISTFNRPVYLQKIVVSIQPTKTQIDFATLDLVDNIGNDFGHYFIGNFNGGTTTTNVTGLAQVLSQDFNPAIIYQGGTVQIKGSFSNIGSAGNAGGVSCTMYTYYC